MCIAARRCRRAFRIVLQNPKRTLLGQDVKMWHEGLTRKLRESLDAELRA